MIIVRNLRRIIRIDNKFIPIRMDIKIYDDIDIKHIGEVIERGLSGIKRIYDIKETLIKGFGNFYIRIRFKSFYKANAPITRKESFEEYEKIYICKKIENSVKEYIGVKVIGISSCPCALEEVREYLRKNYGYKIDGKLLDYILNEFPIGTHNQRSILEIIVETRKENYDEIADRLLKVTRKCFSAETYEVLKRVDEIDVVLRLSRNTNFVEDIIRKAILHIYNEFGREFTNEKIIIKVKSLESIHKHDAFAMKVTRFDKIRERFEKDE